MNKSEQINELAKALSQAQGEMRAVPYDSTNPHFRNQYASLSAFEAVLRPILSKHGLAFTQLAGSDELGHTVTTVLMHSSGQFISETMRLILQKNDMQGLGSAITYARRYMLASMVGISDGKDDDAERAVTHFEEREPAPLPPSKARPKNFAPGSGDTFDTWVIPFGKWTGKTIPQIGIHNALEYRDFLERSAKEKGKALEGAVLKFCDLAVEFAKAETALDSSPQV